VCRKLSAVPSQRCVCLGWPVWLPRNAGSAACYTASPNIRIYIYRYANRIIEIGLSPRVVYIYIRCTTCCCQKTTLAPFDEGGLGCKRRPDLSLCISLSIYTWVAVVPAPRNVWARPHMITGCLRWGVWPVCNMSGRPMVKVGFL
jgi:hypothetical protein